CASLSGFISAGRPIILCLGGPNSVSYQYDAYANRMLQTDPPSSPGLQGSQTHYVYEGTGARLIQIDRAYSTPQQESTSFVYDFYSGLVTTVTDPNGVQTKTTYDAVGRPTLVQEAFGTSVQRNTSTRYATQGRFIVTQRDW